MPSKHRLSWVYPRKYNAYAHGSNMSYQRRSDRIRAISDLSRRFYNSGLQSSSKTRNNFNPDNSRSNLSLAQYIAANRIKRFWKRNLHKIREPAEYFPYYN